MAETPHLFRIGPAEIVQRTERVRAALEEARAYAEAQRSEASDEAEQEAWAGITAVFEEAASQKSSLARLERVREGLADLRGRDLGKGREVEAAKGRIIESFIKRLDA